MSWKLKAIEERIELIEQMPLSGHTYTLQWAGQHNYPFATKHIPIDDLVYRSENFRIRAEVLEILADEKIDLLNEQESQSVQDRLNELLYEAATRDSETNMVKKLSDDGVQTEPLVVTSSGVVVNGNRRLAAMRWLWRQNPVKFASFRKVECIVLPAEADSLEINRLETALQTERNPRQPYSWVDEALMMESQSNEFNWSIAEISHYWNMRASTVKQALSELELVRKYLGFLGKQNFYSLVSQDKQSFKTIAEKYGRWVANHDSLALIDARLTTAWRIISHEGRGHNKYSYIQRIEDVTSRLVEKLRDANEGSTIPVGDESQSEEPDIFGSDTALSTGGISDADVELIAEEQQDSFLDKATDARDESQILGAEKERGMALKVYTEKALEYIAKAQIQASFPQTHLDVVRNCVSMILKCSELALFLVEDQKELAKALDESTRTELLEVLNSLLQEFTNLS